ncbi:SPOR domain-containing protein [uncultured Amphritea sp.]|uniref:SPOR domain-containing protein n=1 Tax=uncultured Amphritea sp. TaxID=981605 RepID=UPI0026137625|nr:SPOR domain-containing protein [uncultured Amphritea sp.]
MHNPTRTLLSTLIAAVIAGGSLTALPCTAADQAQGAESSVIQSSGRYAIHVASLASLADAEDVIKELPFKNQVAYITSSIVEGKKWYRVRVGFFANAKDGEALAATIRNRHPELWITKVPETEKLAAIAEVSRIKNTPLITEENLKPSLPANATAVETPATEPLTETSTPERTTNVTQPIPASKPVAVIASSGISGTSKPASDSDDPLGKIMIQAEQSMIAQEYDRAIQLYTKILREPENQYSRQALEFTGVARERKGQQAQAKASWDQYLEKYPDGADALRVRQRITAMITATETPTTRTTTTRKAEPSRWDVYGGISQFYRRDEFSTETEDFKITSVNRDALSNDLYLTGRYRGDEYDVRTRFSGGYEEDFLDSTQSEARISTLYVDIQDKQATNTLRLGRQSSSSGGVLGRFDGVLAGHSFNETVKLNLVAGFPVETATYKEVNLDRWFYGVNVDLGTFNNAWDYNVFLIEQRNENILDRRAIGGEVRYFQPGKTLFTLLDYDISFNELNTLFTLGSWTNEKKQTFNVSVDYRNSPVLTTTTAIQSQSVNTLSELLATGITEDEARQYALDRTTRSFTTTLGMVQPITDDFQLSGDLTVSKQGDSKTSGGVDGFAGTDYEYSLFVQAIGNNLIKQGDLGIVGIRLTDATTSQRLGLTFNSRYPVNEKLRINPRFQTEYRENTDDNTSQWYARPSVRFEYRWTRKTRFEFETGGEISNRELTTDTSETNSYYINLGYRHDF